MRRCAPAVPILFIALVLSFLVSISVPYITDFDAVRVSFSSTGVTSSDNGAINQLRLGIWGYCARGVTSGSEDCLHSGLAYEVDLQGRNNVSETIKKSWTRGLVMSPVATGFIFLAFVLSFSEHLGMLLIASLMSFMGTLVTIIWMAIDIALFLDVRDKAKKLGVTQNTDFGPSFWMSLAVLILTLLAGFLVCLGRRRQRNAMRADTYVANSNAGTTGYGAKPTGIRRFIPGRKYRLARTLEPEDWLRFEVYTVHVKALHIREEKRTFDPTVFESILQPTYMPCMTPSLTKLHLESPTLFLLGPPLRALSVVLRPKRPPAPSIQESTALDLFEQILRNCRVVEEVYLPLSDGVMRRPKDVLLCSLGTVLSRYSTLRDLTLESTSSLPPSWLDWAARSLQLKRVRLSNLAIEPTCTKHGAPTLSFDHLDLCGTLMPKQPYGSGSAFAAISSTQSTPQLSFT
ncbi:hypothetical protein FRB97_006686 [Tulasnella sp. 331]|nr:hypothetical protein FRB97_006686 [Tulasnella sp. 331]